MAYWLIGVALWRPEISNNAYRCGGWERDDITDHYLFSFLGYLDSDAQASMDWHDYTRWVGYGDSAVKIRFETLQRQPRYV